MNEREIREALVFHGKSLFTRGYGVGTSGNLSVRLEDGGYLMTPTNVSLGALMPEALSRLDETGRLIDGPPATKESWLHLVTYRARPADRAVVHLHSTYATALSCRADLNPQDALPALTPYVVMRVGRVPVVPYSRPGDASVATAIHALAREHQAVLLANHGPVVSGADLALAVAAAEELEETARLFFILEGRPHRTLTSAEVADLNRVFRA